MCAIPLALFALLFPHNTPSEGQPAPVQDTQPVQTEANAPQGQSSERPPHSPEPWGFDFSDLDPSPRIQFSHLKNGMRVAWAQNSEPKQRVYLRLHVNVGSLSEEESERGMAHFLEHMAFNGSDNFAAGTLIKWFQEHGMSFGADTNAHTSFSETVYKLDLPNNTEKTLQEGLTVMRDFASRLHIAEAEVQSEKGVIDGEERERDSAGFRAFIKLTERQFAGTRLPLRIPIGIKSARDAFDAKSVRAFYEAWYRPENMTLVIVGDLGETNPTKLIEEAFADMAGPGTPVAKEPALGTPSMDEVSFVIAEPEIPIAQMMIARLKPFAERRDSVAERKRNLTLSIAHAILQLRFAEALKKPETHFLQAAVSEKGAYKVFSGGELTVVANPDEWEKGLHEAILQLRSALEFGFSQAELDEVRAGMLRELEEAVERESTTDSRALMESILTAAEEHTVPTDARTELAVHSEILEAMSKEDCAKALASAWDGGEVSMIAIGSVPFEDATIEMGRVYESAMQEELKAPEADEVIPFAYESVGLEHPPVERLNRVTDLGVSLIEFSNSVRLNLKETDFKERSVLIRMRLGDGRLGMSAGEQLVADVAGEVFMGGGLGSHDSDALRRLLAGKQARIGLAIREDHIEMSCTTSPEDLLRCLELMCAYLNDPGFRPDALYAVRNQLPAMHEQLMRTPQGPFVMDFLPEFIQGNPRFEWMALSIGKDPKDLVTVSMDEVQALLAPRLSGAPIELTIVGDIDLGMTLGQVGQTFGVLPDRNPREQPGIGRNGIQMVSGLEMVREIDTKDEKATLMLVYPTTDGLDDKRRRQMFFLGQVINDRIRLEVRERLGAAYSPYAACQASRVFSDLGGVLIQASGHPDQIDTLVEACRSVCKELADKGITQEETNRLAEPIQNSLRDMLRTNRYWLDALAQAQGDEESLDSARSLVDFYGSIDAKELSAFAAKYLKPELASQLLVLPTKREATDSQDPESDGDK